MSNEPIQNVLQDPVVILYITYFLYSINSTQLLVQQYEKELASLRQELAMHDLLVSLLSWGTFFKENKHRLIVPVSVMSH